MKKITLMIIAVCVATLANAQFSAGISAGASIPTGDYGNNTDIDNHGFALPGGSFNLELAYTFTETLGVSLLWGGAVHSVDEGAIAAETGVAQKDFSTTEFGVGYFMVGPTVGKSTEDSEIKVHFRIGSIVSISPETTFRGSVIGESETSEAGLGGGVSIDYTRYLDGGFGLFGGIDVIGGEVAFPDYETNVNVLNLKVGLKYRF
jgi:hypothetical protein